MLRLFLIICIALLTILLGSWVALFVREEPDTAARAWSPEHCVKMSLSAIVQGVRGGDIERVSYWFAENIEEGSARVQKNEMKSMFDNALASSVAKREDPLSVFTIDDIQSIQVSNNVATVRLRMPGSNGQSVEEILQYQEDDSGLWKISKTQAFLGRINDFVHKHGTLVPRGNNRSSGSPLSLNTKVNSTVAQTLVESQHALIPFRWASTPVIWFVQDDDAVQVLGKKLFYSTTDIEYVPLELSGTTITSEVGFVIDETWQRIVFGKKPEKAIASYGDHPGQYKFKNPRGIAAEKFPDGSVRVFVANTGNKEIVELAYSPSSNQLSYVRSISLPGLSKPVDVDIYIYSSFSNTYSILVADAGVGSLLSLNQNGTIVSRVDSYSYQGVTYPLNQPERIARGNGSQSSGYVAFIDREENAFVVLNYLNASTFSNVVAFTQFSSPSLLTNIGQIYPGDFVVTDWGLNKVHLFAHWGTYHASFHRFSSSAAMNPSFFSNVANVTLFDHPTSFTSRNYYAQIGHYSSSSANSWGSKGFNRFRPGADIVNFAVSYPTGGIQFDYDLTNYSKFSSKVYKNGAEIYNFETWQYDVSGHRVNAVQWSQLGQGPFALKITVEPGGNADYSSDYKQNPLVLTYNFSQPLAVTMSGPTAIEHPQKPNVNQYTWTANVTSGTPPYTYVWKKNGSTVGTNSQTYTEYLSYDGNSCGSSQWTLRVDVTGGGSAYATKNVTEYHSCDEGPIDPKIVDNEYLVVIPEDFIAAQNYPNPFNPTTEISFGLPEPSSVNITIYDMLGREITTLVNREYSAGYKKVTWNGVDQYGKQVGSGVYFYRITATGQSGKQFTKSVKMALTK